MDNKITRKYTVFDDNNDSSAEEKTDATPENMKKIDDVILSSITDNKTSFNNYGNVEKTSIKENIFKTTGTAGVVLNDELKIIEDESPPNSPISSINDISNNSSTAQQQQNLAFTIDFVGGNTQNNTKYKTMLERFQNRHRRGASMSKLDNNINCDDNCNNSCSNNKINSSPIVTKTPRISSSSSSAAAAQNRDSRKNYNDTEAGKIKLRIRERSTSGVKDPLKRHSWSPRSSTVEPNFSTTIATPTAENLQQKQQSNPNTQNKLKSSITVLNNEQQQRQQPVNNEKHHQRQQLKLQTSIENNRKTSNSGIYKQSGRNDFAPRSTAMQMALDKIDFLGLQPPLDNYIESNKNYNLIDGCGANDGNDDNISETGTYTLDGDNYTEEQKDLMNIDKTLSEMGQISNERPSELSIYSFSSIKSQQQEQEQSEKRYKNNILEVNYYHDSTTNVEQTTKPKISYLEKIKSKVKNFTKSPDKIINKQQQQMCSSDKGTFTSITTSGILAKKLTLDPNPKLNYHKNSLTTSQLDSSEYIGNDYIMKSSATPTTNINNSETAYYTSGVFTDHEKAEYHLLNKQQNSNSDGCDDCDIENEPQPLTPDCTSINNKIDFKKYSDTAGLKTAQTKSDWIQEWARNARARSVSTAITSSSSTNNNNNNKNDKILNGLMSRSYNCEATNENQSELIDNINYSPGNSDYLYNRKNNGSLLYKNMNSSAINDERKKSLSELILTARPPVSPSKIPSPMHSIGRSRSVNKNNNNCRSSLQDLSPASQYDTNTDIYLQKTAAAISNLSQNLSRKNSIRSLNSINSPRKNLQQYNMINNDNNLFKIPTDNDNRNNIIQHKRNLSLDYRLQNNSNKKSMSNSLNETINDYRLPRPRINSFDSNNLQQYQQYNNNNSNCSPRQLASNYIDQTLKLIKQNHQQQQQSLSPLRRSSSFSTNKIGRMTPPTTAIKSILPTTTSVINNQRYNNNSNSQSTTPKNSLQKSASSNSFRKMYSNDYDDSIAYYINDEDDLDYCSSEEFDDQNESSQQQQQPDIPLTNTRYNKALLMRIENSKQKVPGGSNSGGNITTTKPAPGGVMACPNTPEMPRRQQNIQQQQQRNSMRQSVPRDSSLNRLKGDVPNSLASAKKQLLQTAAVNSSSSSTKPQPRYLDISKYKPQQGSGNTFLKKNESKITLKNDIRRSPSSVSVSLSRNDPSRSSSRSTRSNVGGGKPSSVVNRRDQSISKQKETELAMWKRRATYDPMKAAAEDKRKKEEAKKLLIKSTESSSVLRSQSFHCGVGGLTNLDNNNKINLTRRNSQTPDDNCWTLISSDDEDDEEDGTFISSSTNTN